MPLTRQMSNGGKRPGQGLAPIQLGLPGTSASVNLDSPHLTGLSNVLAGAGLATPTAAPSSRAPLANPDAWKQQHMPAAAGTRGGGARTAEGPLSPNKRKSPEGHRFREPAAVEEDDEDDELVPAPESPTKRRSSIGRSSFSAPPPEAEPVRVTDIFSPGLMRCPVFRIPSVLPLPDGVVLAFAEARQSWHDHGVIDLVCRRSEDNGYTWGSGRTVVGGASIGLARLATVGNPAAVWDRDTQTVWLLFCSNLKEDQEWQIHAREGRDTEGRRVWVTSSTDLGKSWAPAKEITTSVKRRDWTWYATGPGVGVQLQSGRLLIPCNHAEDVEETRHPYLVSWQHSRMVAHCVYSDDHGASWHVGGVAAPHTNEATLAERADGSVVLNMRDWTGRYVRQVQTSTDGGTTWQRGRHDHALIEPKPQGCQGCLLAVPPKRGGGEALFFCNPASEQRDMLTVRRSDDGGHTWPGRFVLEEGGAAYSCMGLLSDGKLCVLYERADRISFATIAPSSRGPLGTF